MSESKIYRYAIDFRPKDLTSKCQFQVLKRQKLTKYLLSYCNQVLDLTTPIHVDLGTIKLKDVVLESGLSVRVRMRFMEEIDPGGATDEKFVADDGSSAHGRDSRDHENTEDALGECCQNIKSQRVTSENKVVCGGESQGMCADNAEERSGECALPQQPNTSDICPSTSGISKPSSQVNSPEINKTVNAATIETAKEQLSSDRMLNDADKILRDFLNFRESDESKIDRADRDLDSKSANEIHENTSSTASRTNEYFKADSDDDANSTNRVKANRARRLRKSQESGLAGGRMFKHALSQALSQPSSPTRSAASTVESISKSVQSQTPSTPKSERRQIPLRRPLPATPDTDASSTKSTSIGEDQNLKEPSSDTGFEKVKTLAHELQAIQNQILEVSRKLQAIIKLYDDKTTDTDSDTENSSNT